MKMMTAIAATAFLAATSFAYANPADKTPDNLAFVTQVGNFNSQITLQTADPTKGKDQDPANLAVTTQLGWYNSAATLQSANHGVTNASFTFQDGVGNKSLTIQGPGHH